MDFEIVIDNVVVIVRGQEAETNIYAGTIEGAERIAQELAIKKLKGEWS